MCGQNHHTEVTAMRRTRTVPLPESEIQKITKPGLPATTREAVRRLACVMHVADQFGEHDKRQKRSAHNMDKVEKIGAFFLAHSYHLGRATCELAMLGHGAPALVLVRAMMESTTDLAYLWLCKKIPDAGEQERDAWAMYSDKTFHKVVNLWDGMRDRQQKTGSPPSEPLVSVDQAARLAQGSEEFTKKFGKRNGWASIDDLSGGLSPLMLLGI